MHRKPIESRLGDAICFPIRNRVGVHLRRPICGPGDRTGTTTDMDGVWMWRFEQQRSERIGHKGRANHVGRHPRPETFLEIVLHATGDGSVVDEDVQATEVLLDGGCSLLDRIEVCDIEVQRRQSPFCPNCCFNHGRCRFGFLKGSASQDDVEDLGRARHYFGCGITHSRVGTWIQPINDISSTNASQKSLPVIRTIVEDISKTVQFGSLSQARKMGRTRALSRARPRIYPEACGYCFSGDQALKSIAPTSEYTHL